MDADSARDSGRDSARDAARDAARHAGRELPPDVVRGGPLKSFLTRYHKTALVVVLCLCAFLLAIRQGPPANSIEVIHHPTQEFLDREGVAKWDTWDKEPSDFMWHFTQEEIAYVLEGEVYLTPEGSKETVVIRQGDFVRFAPGLRCHWLVTKQFKKRVTQEDNPINRWRWKITFGLQAVARKLGWP